ncbi:MAG: transposase, partial [Vampirovibrionales bacterium]|nr:transposase [Vampirovibrionales bacterium]
LSPYRLVLILSEGSFSCVKAANSLGFVSHDHLTRELTREFRPNPIGDWEKLPRKGVLVIDDTVIAKPHSEVIEGVKWQYASSKDKVLPGINLLLGLWVIGETVYVLEVFFPGDENRNELVQALLKRVKEEGLEVERVLSDAWYAASKTLNLIHTLGWTYVCRMRSNRIFNGEAIETYAFHGAQGKTGKLKGVYANIQIVKHDDRYLVTNELTPHTSRTLAHSYGERWVLETVFRDLKSILHLEKCSCRNLEAQSNHALSVLAASLSSSQHSRRSTRVSQAIPMPSL